MGRYEDSQVHPQNPQAACCWLQPVQDFGSYSLAILADSDSDYERPTANDGEAGPSSPPRKENQQPAAGRVSANTRGGFQMRKALTNYQYTDTRGLTAPTLKAQVGGGASASAPLVAEPNGSVAAGSFYTSGRLAGPLQGNDHDGPSDAPRRQSIRVQKRKAEQVSNAPGTPGLL